MSLQGDIGHTCIVSLLRGSDQLDAVTWKFQAFRLVYELKTLKNGFLTSRSSRL
jgi:hypothetical protein